MDAQTRDALADYLLALADDELILAHRHSEWTGHGPILEEDIAFTNIALDELGHATIWYELRQALTGEDPDQLVFFRDPGAFRNVQMVELPNGDWGFSMLRQYFFDMAEQVRLSHLKDSSYEPLAQAAAKILTEEIYHVRHTSMWLQRLGLGTEESNARMQQALDTLWPYTRQLFGREPGDEHLIDAGIVPDPDMMYREWLAIVEPFLAACNLTIPADVTPQRHVPRSEHTEALMTLLTELQSVAHLDPMAEW